MQNEYSLLLISVDSPVLLGVYKDENLIDSTEMAGKFSEILPCLFDGVFKGELLNKDFKGDSSGISKIFYTNGPGNFSAIKMTHIFLQTIKIARNIPLFCTDAFAFSQNEFINAYGKIHFYKQNGEILTTPLSQKLPNSFALPTTINPHIFSNKCEPLYILPAV